MTPVNYFILSLSLSRKCEYEHVKNTCNHRTMKIKYVGR